MPTEPWGKLQGHEESHKVCRSFQVVWEAARPWYRLPGTAHWPLKEVLSHWERWSCLWIETRIKPVQRGTHRAPEPQRAACLKMTLLCNLGSTRCKPVSLGDTHSFLLTTTPMEESCCKTLSDGVYLNPSAERVQDSKKTEIVSVRNVFMQKSALLMMFSK